MPHFGLMDSETMQPDAAALMRAKLHFRCGKRRLREGKFSEGITTLYDALTSSMRWYAFTNEAAHAEIHRLGESVLEDDVKLQQLLVDLGVWPMELDFHKLLVLVDNALANNVKNFDHNLYIKQFESILTSLGVLPFEESELPLEDPATF